MVELCELHIIPDDDQWPDDIDSRIAALNFGGDSVLFESLIDGDDDADANIVSTDSLDSQKFRELSQVKKDDFQLAFADSGHWQSGIINEPGGVLTTWGRIRTSEPLDERTASAPNVVFGGGTTGRTLTHTSKRPNSLIANFVDTTKYVDLNDNEIREIDEQHVEVLRKDRWRRELKTAEVAAAAALPKRTFADILEKTKKERAPKLEFLAMHHEMPSLCESFTASFRDVILKTQKEPVPTTLTTDFPLNYYSHEEDSGLGCSGAAGGPSHIEDWQSLCVLLPKHVAEACSFFKSNTQLLMSNNNTSSSRKTTSPRRQTQNLCIDQSSRRVGISASANEACRTCYRVKRRIHPPVWAQTATSKQVLCDCAATATTPSDTQLSFAPTTSTTRHQLRARELSIVGLPIYSQKRCLIENVVEGVAAISRGEGCEDLVVAMRALIEDGLLEGVSPWNMIKTVTSKGPATKDVHSIVRQLEECQKSDAAKVEIFFEELIRENSLDCWLCYIVLKEKALKKLYHVDSFLVSASAEYRTLLWRMVDSLSLLAVIEARTSTTSSAVWQRWGGASRIAADSRVPKSSSVPARLATATTTSRSGRQQPSRIPLSTSRTSFTSTSSTPRTISRTFRIATVIADYTIEQFNVTRGEKLRVLSTRHGMARVVRIAADDVVAKLRNGLIPVENLST